MINPRQEQIVHIGGLSIESPKKVVLGILKKLPESSSLEDIQYHIYVREKIEKGLKESKRGKVISQKAVEIRAEKWL